MNLKTTMVLALAVVAVSAAYLMWGSGSGVAEPEMAGADTVATPKNAGTAETLPSSPFDGDTRIVQVTYQRRGHEKMVFERTDDKAVGTGEWVMKEPAPCTATAWVVNNIVLALKGLKFAHRYPLQGAEAVSLETAGIRPEPVIRLSATSEQGKTFEVQVGQTLIGQDRPYVFLPEHPESVFVADSDMRNVLDKKLAEFRDKRVFKLTPANAVELTVVERGDDGEHKYSLRKQDGEWVFLEPFQARAESKKIQDVVGNLNRLYVTAWLDEAPSRLAEFGLDPSYLDVRVVTEETVAKQVEPESQDSEPQDSEPQDSESEDSQDGSAPTQQPETAPEVKRQEFEVHISKRSPIDDDKLVYISRGNEKLVGTVNSTQSAKLAPVLSEWRDMKLVEFKAADANSLKIRLSDATVQLERRGQEWFLPELDEAAEPAEVSAVLSALDGLKAVNFVDGAAEPAVGLDPPQAEITLGFPDRPAVEIIRIGDYTEQTTRRLRYAQRVGSPTPAKIKSADVKVVFRDWTSYRNREVFDYEPSRILKIELSRRLADVVKEQSLTLERDDSKVWHMTAPLAAAVNLQTVNDVVGKLARLRGTKVVDDLDPDKLGLTSPDIRLVMYIEGVPTVQAGDAGTPGPVPSETIVRQLNMSKSEGQVYGTRLDQSTFMTFDSSIYDALMSEFLDSAVWQFEPSEIVAFGSADGEHEVQFRKVHDRWQYVPEPDLPMDTAKIDAHIATLRNLKTERFVDYNSGSLSEWGLDSPAQRIFVETSSGARHEIQVSDRVHDGAVRGQYAVVAGTSRVFILSPDAVRSCMADLLRFEAAE